MKRIDIAIPRYLSMIVMIVTRTVVTDLKKSVMGKIITVMAVCLRDEREIVMEIMFLTVKMFVEIIKTLQILDDLLCYELHVIPLLIIVMTSISEL